MRRDQPNVEELHDAGRPGGRAGVFSGPDRLELHPNLRSDPRLDNLTRLDVRADGISAAACQTEADQCDQPRNR
jgi:hypothetical protein